MNAVVTELAAPPQRDVTTTSLVMDGNAIEHMLRIADLMATAVSTVPNHFRGKPGDCLAVVMQAMQWEMNPYAVAQKTHLVNGTLGYEAQLVNAVVRKFATRGEFSYEYRGDKGKVECRVGAVLKGNTDITWGEWLSEADVTTKNSPLWKTNPRQQLGYLQVKNWARAFAPGAILGVYTNDELADMPERDMGNAEIVTPPAGGTRTDQVKSLIAKKGEAKAPTLRDFTEAVAAAGTLAALESLKAMGEQLPEAEVPAARKAFKARQAALKTQAEVIDNDTGEITGGAPKFTFAEVEERLREAKNRDQLDTAATGIQAFSKEDQKLLGDEYRRLLALLEAA
jgi:hypothetical protein